MKRKKESLLQTTLKQYILHRHINAWIFVFNTSNKRKIINVKKFISFDKRSKNPEKIPMIFEIDKKQMLLQYNLKNFHFNLVAFYEKSLLKKYYAYILQYGIIRRKNKSKGKYLENLFNSRSAICILKLWQLKSTKKIEEYKKISQGSLKLKALLKKRLFNELCKNMREIGRIHKMEMKSISFFNANKKKKVFIKFSKMLKKRNNKNKAIKLVETLLKYKSFGVWKKKFQKKKEKTIKLISAQRNFNFLLEKK